MVITFIQQKCNDIIFFKIRLVCNYRMQYNKCKHVTEWQAAITAYYRRHNLNAVFVSSSVYTLSVRIYSDMQLQIAEVHASSSRHYPALCVQSGWFPLLVTHKLRWL